jgi:hypothetical protein
MGGGSKPPPYFLQFSITASTAVSNPESASHLSATGNAQSRVLSITSVVAASWRFQTGTSIRNKAPLEAISPL